MESPINPAMRFPEKNHASGNDEGGNEQGSAQGIINILFEFFSLHKPEISRFEGKEDQGIQERDQGINQAHFAIFYRPPELIRQVRR